MNEQAKQAVKELDEAMQEVIDHMRVFKQRLDENNLERACMAANFARRANNRAQGYIEELIELTLPFRV